MRLTRERERVEAPSKDSVVGKNRKNGVVFFVLLIFCVISFGLIFNPNSTHADTTSNLVGWWTLDSANTNWSASTTADSSGSGITGTITNVYSSTSTVSGPINQALSFDGVNDYVALASNPISDFAAANSGCAWVNKPDKTILGQTFNLALDLNNYVSLYAGTGGSFSVTYRLLGTQYGKYSLSNAIMVNNTWTHLCYVWDGAAVTLYANGAVTSGSSPGSTSSGGAGNTIGRRGVNGDYWPGKIDDVRVYSRALSAPDVVQLYTFGFTPSVSTSAASSVTSITATVSGSIDFAITASSTNRGFAWGTNSNLSGGDTATTTDPGTWGTGAFSYGATGLSADTAYYFRAYALNATSTGFGSIQTFTTASSVSVPTLTTSDPTSISSSTMTLNANISATGGGSITQSGFAYGTAPDLSTVIATTSLGSQPGTGNFSGGITNLNTNTLYYFRAYAVNSAGTSTGAILSTTTSLWAVPGQPASITAATSSPNQATISFTAPVSNGGSTILYYVASSTPGNFTATSTGSPIIVHGLSNATAYTFQVYAVNAVGTGSPSSVSNAVTPIGVPGAPTSVTAATSTPNQATVSFTAPASNGGSSVLYYVASSTPGNFTATSTGSPIAVSGLTNGNSYTFQVYAVNIAGTSTPSSASNAVTPIANGADIISNLVGYWTFDAANTNWPASTTADTSGSGNTGSLNNFYSATSTVVGVVNQALAFDGTSSYISISNPITDYTSPNSGCAWVNTSNYTLGEQIFNLAQDSNNYASLYIGTSGHFTVAYRSLGTQYGTYSSVAIANNTWTQFCYVWNGSAVTLYENGSAISGNGPGTASNGGNGNTIGRRGVNADSYWLGNIDDVRIYSRALASGDITQLYKIGYTPTVVTSTASPVGNTTATLNGNITVDNATGSSTARGFAYGTSPTLTTVIATTTETGTFGTGAFTSNISSLNANTTYYVRAYASTTIAIGYGSIQSFTTQSSVSLPSVTTSLPTQISSSTMTFNGAITANGGADATQSGFAYGTTNDLSVVVATTTDGPQSGIVSFLHNVSNLIPNTLYYFRAYAVNSAGTSTGAILSTTTLQWSVPGAPTSVTAATSTPNRATISFTAPAPNGFPVLYYVASSTPGNFTATSTGSPIIVSGLTDGTSYTFQVYAVNIAGTSTPSSVSNAVTPIDNPAGLVSWWKFDDGSGTTALDSSGNGDTGTLTNGPTWVTGKAGSGALSFDGSSTYVSLPSNPISDFSAANSGCVWVNASDITHTSGGNAGNIYNISQDANNFVSIYTTTSGSFSVGYKLAGTHYGKYSSVAALTNNTWTHLCYTWDGAVITLYKNGALASASAAGATSGGGISNVIGRNGSNDDGYWLGKIDDVRVYNRTLTVSEITDIYDSANPINETPVISGSSAISVTLPDTATLSDLVIDDGLPAGYSVTNAWSKVSGPGTVTFASSTKTVTDVTFSVAGTYTVRLTSTDGDLTTTADTVVTVLPSPLTLKVQLSGTGSGTVTGSGITCGSDCSETYSSVTSVTLTATPSSGSTFIGWVGGGCTGTGTCTLTVDSAKTVAAFFDTTGTGTSVFYVDTDNGSASDSNPGTQSLPWKTIQHAATTATAGAKVIVRAGEYNEFIIPANSGTASNPIVFEGERDADGNWLTIIDPSTNASTGWVAAPEIGVGVYKKTDVGFNTRELTIDHKRVAFVHTMGDMTSDIDSVYSSSGYTTGAQLLALPADTLFTISGQSIRFWDGLEALYGTSGNTTYLRLRDGSDPNGLNIRAVAGNSGIYISDKSYIVFRNIHIRSSYISVSILGTSAQHNTFENNYMENGYMRVYLTTGAHDNVVRNNEMTTNYYGYSDPGAWAGSTEYRFVIRESNYLISKHFLSDSVTSLDYNVHLYFAGNSNVISGNHIFKGLGSGVTVGGDVSAPTQNTDIFGNTIEGQPSIGITPSDGETGTMIHGNLISDNDINIRFHKFDSTGETNRIAYVYGNKLWLPDNVGSHIYFHFNHPTGTPYHPEIWMYHNSFSGGGNGLSVSSYAFGNGGLPGLRIMNNIFSGAAYINDGEFDTGFLTDISMIGIFDYNLITPPALSKPAYDPAAWFGANNVRLGVAIWGLTSVPDFSLSAGSGAIDAGIDLSSQFTIGGTTYDVLSGMTSGYYGGTAPDIGAYEIYTVPGAPTGVTALAGDTTAAISFTAPASNGGSAILYYLASSTPGNFTATSTGSPIVVTGLVNATSYTFAVYAVNAVGTSSPSADSNAVVPNAGIVAPTLTTSDPTSVASSTMTLNANISATGGASITGSGFAYGTVADLSTGAATTSLGSQSTGDFNGGITGLTPNTLYYFRAYALNSAGTSTGEILSTTTLQWSVPGTPTSASAATSSPNQATVSFTAPASNGGATITGYTVNSSPSGGTDSNDGTTALTHVVTGLINGTAYTFTVTATNSNGTSSASDPSNPVTPTASVLPTYTIGGTISGLSGTVILQNNTGDNLSVSANGSFTFVTKLIDAATYSVTVLTQPSSQTCSVSSGSGTVSTEGITSVSVTCSDNAVTPTPTPVTTSYSSGVSGSFYVAPKIIATTTTATTTCTTLMYPIITKQLSLGMTGNDVMLLQKILALEQFFTTSSTSGIYGAQTMVAVSSFQKKNNIVISGTPETTGFGNVGPKTRTFINQLISKGKYPSLGQCITSMPVLNTATTTAQSYRFTRSLTLGSTGSDVKALQVFLNAHGFTINSSGVGSSGNETTYFGSATRAALMKFQEYYAKDVLTPNGLTKGTGFFGASTMKKVNAMMK